MTTYKEDSGFNIGMAIMKVVSIPHISIIDNNYEQVDAVENRVLALKSSMKTLLNSVYSAYERVRKPYNNCYFSIEFRWVTVPVDNQPYKSDIQLFLILRGIKHNEIMDGLIEQIQSAFKTSLESNKYIIETITYEDFIANMPDLGVNVVSKALVKGEGIARLSSPMMPSCYTFDRLTPSSIDFHELVATLIKSSSVYLSFFLQPTFLQQQEQASIGNYNQQLSMLSGGINTGAMGNIAFVAAEKELELYSYYAHNLQSPLFEFFVLVSGNNVDVQQVSSSVIGMLGSNTSMLQERDVTNENISQHENLYYLPWRLSSDLKNNNAHQQYKNFAGALWRMPFIVTAEEASEFAYFPFATNQMSAGLIVNETIYDGRKYKDGIITSNGGEHSNPQNYIEIGELKGALGHKINLPLKEICKHLFVCGTPGMGKSTFSVGLLDRLWKNYDKDHRVPFLVIEPAKNEYRAMLQSIPELQVFTPGKDFISPFVLNPFIPPKGVVLQNYKSYLKSIFKAAVTSSEALSKIIEETIDNCYADFGWLDHYTSDDGAEVFGMDDFIKCFQTTFDEIGYKGEVQNMGKAGVLRLKSLARFFSNYNSISAEDILCKPTVIELNGIPDADEKAVMTTIILSYLFAYLDANRVGETQERLKNLILIEESHVLLSNISEKADGSANPSAEARKLIVNALAERRSQGVGFVIADQSPNAVGYEVVRLTGTKVAYRLVESGDKNLLGESISLTDAQKARLGRFTPGEAFIHGPGIDAEEIKTPNYRIDSNISISISDKGVAEHCQYWRVNGRQLMLRPYPQCALIKSCSNDCSLELCNLARQITRRIYRNNSIGKMTLVKELNANVLSSLEEQIKEGLNREPYSERLLQCVRAQLLRRVFYESHIPISIPKINAFIKSKN